MLSIRHPFKTLRIVAQKVVAQFLISFDGCKTAIVSKDSLGLIEKINRDDQVSRIIKENVHSHFVARVNFLPIESIMVTPRRSKRPGHAVRRSHATSAALSLSYS